jgi:hypothetical protein
MRSLRPQQQGLPSLHNSLFFSAYYPPTMAVTYLGRDLQPSCIVGHASLESCSPSTPGGRRPKPTGCHSWRIERTTLRAYPSSSSDLNTSSLLVTMSAINSGFFERLLYLLSDVVYDANHIGPHKPSPAAPWSGKFGLSF